jgi:hypothetical protein
MKSGENGEKKIEEKYQKLEQKGKKQEKNCQSITSFN